MPTVGLLTLSLQIQHAQSLKDKRQTVRSLTDRLRRRHNVSVAETGFQDAWQRAEIGVVTISAQRQRAEQVLQHVEREAARLLGDDLAAVEAEFF